MRLASVSYTHLDVYKRQVHNIHKILVFTYNKIYLFNSLFVFIMSFQQKVFLKVVKNLSLPTYVWEVNWSSIMRLRVKFFLAFLIT